ncbi:MAG: PilZ domain-containing protein [Nitrococcus mobilis]|nr:PilZ domain-containing protein [Nitrococcus mobilis]
MAGGAMKDARRRARDVVDKFLPVYHRETKELIGYLTDVTVDGGMLETGEPLGEEFFPLRIELTDEINGSRHIDIDARCVWTRKDRNAVFHNSGFEFQDITTEARARIAELAERYRLNISK